MEYRFATDGDLQRLAEWNYQLIRDEGHRNPLKVPELLERMREWLLGQYKAVIFINEIIPVAYALYREVEEEIYLRQMFVAREYRHQGIGREAIGILREEVWPKTKRLIVEVLTVNVVGVRFWRAVGYKDYCLTLEIMPQK